MNPKLPLVAITATHIYEGDITVVERFQEVLNDAITDFLHLEGVSVVRVGEPDVTLHESSSMTINKEAVVAAVLTTEEHEAPKSRVSHRAPKAPQRVFICAEGIEVEGFVHLNRVYDDPTEAMSLELKKFFAVTDARISFPAVDDEPVEAPVALVNRNLLTALALEA